MRMGLIGLARDSVADLTKLIHDDDNDVDMNKPPLRRNRPGSESLPASNGSELGTESQASFEQSLNDNGYSGITPANSPPIGRGTSSAPASTPRSSATAAASATAYSKADATNSRPLESYRLQKNSGKNESSHNQGFQYEGYTDYYSEDYGYYKYDDGGGRGDSTNIFCCLFAPWMQKKAIKSDAIPPPDVLPSGSDAAEHVKPETVTVASSTPKNNAAQSSASASDPEPAKEVVALPSSPTRPPTSPVAPVAAQSDIVTNMLSPATPTLQETDRSKVPPKVPTAGAEVSVLDSHQLKKVVNFVSPSKSVEKQPTTPHMLASDRLDSSSTVGSGCDEKKQEDEEVNIARGAVTFEAAPEEQVEEEGPPPIKGIMKVRRCSASIQSNNSSSSLRNSINKGVKKEAQSSASSKQHRHLFPSYEPKNKPSDTTKSIKFNPMARVLTIPSRKDIPFHQKTHVWWQRCDYDEFKKTGRIISKAMECGGSEIWLTSSNAWGPKTSVSTPKSSVESAELSEYEKALSRYVNVDKKGGNNGNGNGDTTGNKWWCKFGHSRRGLEHVACSSEGRARQQSVLLASRMVLEEQKRQRVSHTKDPNKLRNVALQYTSWARDLSFAAGSADAEAVASNFCPSAACRAQHFAKQLNVYSVNCLETLNQSGAVGGGVAMAITSQILDANAHSSVSRSSQKKPQAKALKDMNADSEDLLRKRSKGFLPGSSTDLGFRSVRV